MNRDEEQLARAPMAVGGSAADTETEMPVGTALFRLYAQLPAGRRRQFRWTIALMIIGGLAELATIGAVYPFLALLLPANGTAQGALILNALRAIGTRLGLGQVATAAALLILIAVVSAVLRLILTRITYKFAFGAARDLGVSLYSRILDQPYAFHVMRNSSDTLAGLEKVQHIVAYVLIPMMLALTSAGVACFLVAGMIALNPVVALSGALIFAALYAAVVILTAGSLHEKSRQIGFALKARIQTVQEGLGGIRDVILDQSQAVFRDEFTGIEETFRNAQTTSYFISAAPRFVIEAALLIVIAVLSLFMNSRSGGLVAALPMLGAMAVATQRLLPLIQQVYASWSNISSNRTIVKDVVDLLSISSTAAPGDSSWPTPFTDSVELAHVTFRYPSSRTPSLIDINLRIPRGSRIGIAGKSGSGKSTLVDILMGLLEPSEGELKVDGITLDEPLRAGWRRQVAHVPQSIYLSDSSIATNIAFGKKSDEVDFDRVRQAAERADIHDFIMSLPERYSTRVGERGVRLSGGQRQRIGIARALYKGADLLILDEATSALDDATESAVLEAVAGLSRDITLIMIAHRVTTLRDCELIVEMQSGRISRIGSFEEVVGTKRK